MKNIGRYYTELTETTDERIRFIFESSGNQNIIKVIEYQLIFIAQGRKYFNLGFGDYMENTGEIMDEVSSNNGDVYMVLNTVLSTIPVFFESYPDAAIYISGSDESESFSIKCRITCQKKCHSNCKNLHRRMKVYHYFLKKYYSEMRDEVIIFGKKAEIEQEIMPFDPSDNKYEFLLVLKKK